MKRVGIAAKEDESLLLDVTGLPVETGDARIAVCHS